MPALQAQTTLLGLYGAEVRAQGFAYASLELYQLIYIPTPRAAVTTGGQFAFSQHPPQHPWWELRQHVSQD